MTQNIIKNKTKAFIMAIATLMIATMALPANAQDCKGGFYLAITHDEFRACIDKGEDVTDTSYFNVITNKKIPVSVTKLLIEAGLDVNSRYYNFIPIGDPGWEHNRNTALHAAAIRSDVNEIIPILINAGASVHLRNIIGQTPLSLAVFHNNIEGVKLLLAAGSDINSISIDKSTPAHWAAQALNPSIEIIKLLVSAGANLKAKNVQGRTPRDVYADEFGRTPTAVYRALRP